MILLRLLSAGKTLVGMGREPQGYRLPEGEGLPRFGGKKNPFRSCATPQGEPGRPRGEQPAVAGPLVAPTEIKAPQPKQGAPAPGKAQIATRPEPVKRKSGQTIVSKLLRAPRSLFKKSAGAGAEQAANIRPCQGELRLETVRVVRNDLSESDIEIVPREAAAVSTTRVNAVNSEKGNQVRTLDSAWGRVSARIFGPGNVRLK